MFEYDFTDPDVRLAFDQTAQEQYGTKETMFPDGYDYSDPDVALAVNQTLFEQMNTEDLSPPADEPSEGASWGSEAWEAAKNIPSTLATAGRGIRDAAIYGLPEVVAQGAEQLFDENPRSEDDWKDALIRRSKEYYDNKPQVEGADGLALPSIPGLLPEGMSKKDLSEGLQSLPYSAVGMAGSLGGRVIGGVGGGLTAGPAGIVPGQTAGSLAGSALAITPIARNQIERELIYTVEEAKGQKLTPEETGALLLDSDKMLDIHTAGEVVPEMVGNTLELGFLSKIIGKTPAGTKILKKFALKGLEALKSLGVELSTETLTTQIQQPQEIKMGMRPGETPRSMTSGKDWATSLQEVAPAVIGLQGVMGGGATAAGMLRSNKEASDTDTDPSKDTVETDTDKSPVVDATDEIEEFRSMIEKEEMTEAGVEVFVEEIRKDEPDRAAQIEAAFFPEKVELQKAADEAFAKAETEKKGEFVETTESTQAEEKVVEEQVVETVAEEKVVVPAEPSRYFNEKEGAQTMALKDIQPRNPITSEVDKAKLVRGRELMSKAAAGKGEKRDPITVYKRKDGKTVVISGNTTYHVLQEQGIENIPVTVVGEVLQPTKKLKVIYTKAEESRGGLKSLTEKFAKEAGGTASFRPDNEVKDVKRAEEKAKAYGTAAKLKDILASTISFKSEEEMYKALDKFDENHAVAELKNRFKEPMLSGYRDISMTVSMPNGHLVEIQFTTDNMLNAKNSAGHVLYEISRELESVDRPGAAQLKTDLDVLSKQYYEAAFASKDASSDAFSSEMMVESARIYEALSGEIKTLLSPKSLNKFRSLSSQTNAVLSDSKNISDIKSPPVGTDNVIQDSGIVKKKTKEIKKDALPVSKPGSDPVQTRHEERLSAAAQQMAHDAEASARVEKPVTKHEKAIAKALKRLFGVDVVYYTSDNKTVNDYNGFTEPGRKVIYVNKKAQSPLAFVAGHELLHQLKAQSPKLYSRLVDRVILKSQAWKDFVAQQEKDYDGDTNLQTDPAGLFEELLADFTGDQFTNPEFWDKLSQDKTLFHKVKNLLKSILKKLQRTAIGTPYIENVEEMQAALAEALKEFSGEYKSKPVKPGDPAYSKGKEAIAQASRNILFSYNKKKISAAIEGNALSPESIRIAEGINVFAALDKELSTELSKNATAWDKKGKKILGPISKRTGIKGEYGVTKDMRPSWFNIQKAFETNPALKKKVEAAGKKYGGTLFDKKGDFISHPIELRTKPAGKDVSEKAWDTLPKFGGFRRSITQTYLDNIYVDRESLRSDINKYIETIYKSGERADLLQISLKAIGNTGGYKIPSAVRSADKTVGAVNLNSMCPMFMIGAHGCYFDGCYVTGALGSGPTGTNFYGSAMYLGEILQLSDDAIKTLNTAGGLRMNGSGDTVMDQLPQWEDIFRHAQMRKLKMKVISKQDATFQIVDALMSSKDKQVSAKAKEIVIQPTVDPYWVAATEDDYKGAAAKMYGAGVKQKGKRLSRDLIKFYRDSGRDAKMIGGEVYRKYGFSWDQINELSKKYPNVKVQPRLVVGTYKEIAEYALNTPEALQTWMHAAIRPGMYSEVEGRVLGVRSEGDKTLKGKSEVGNFDARIAVQKVDGEWRILAQVKRGELLTKTKVLYTELENYIKDNYKPSQQEKIFSTLAGQIGKDPSALCCSISATVDECLSCTSSCHQGTFYTGSRLGEISDRGQGLADTDEAPLKFSKAPPIESDAFKKWFGDSKVVDENGDPLVVYHGTDVADNIDEFDMPTFFAENSDEASAYAFPRDYVGRERLKRKYKKLSGKELIGEVVNYIGIVDDIPNKGEVWATDNGVVRVNKNGTVDVFNDVEADYESGYIPNKITLKKSDSSAYDEFVADANETIKNVFSDSGENGRVYPVYLSIKKPKKLNAFQTNIYGKRLSGEKGKLDWEKTVARLKKEGYDGIETTSDEVAFFPDLADVAGDKIKHFLPFSPTQIKSATGNVGTFDPENPDIRFSKASEVDAFRKANNLPEIKMRKDGSHPTQIATTQSTYKKIQEMVADPAKKVLDYGAGKNIGGKVMQADTFEPFPEKNFVPTFSNTAEIPSGSYDVVINNAVLNVVPDDIRDAIVGEIGRVLVPGGKAYINVRGKDVFDASHTVIDKDNMEVIIKGTGAYQKGFTSPELIDYLQTQLGGEFVVEKSPKKFGAVNAVVTKISESRYTDKIMYSKSKDSTEFKAWSKGYPVYEGPQVAKVKPGKGFVAKVYHGTTHEIEAFDAEKYGTVEGYLGQVNYFTTDKQDADEHYKGGGPDLERRVDDLAERLYDMDLEELGYWLQDNGEDPGMTNAVFENTEALEQIAREQLTGYEDSTLDLYTRMDNPAIIGGDTETWIDLVPEGNRTREEAIAENPEMDEDEIDELLMMDRFENESPVAIAIEQAVFETTGESGADIFQSLELDDTVVSATELNDRLRSSEDLMYLDTEQGENATSHIIGQVFKNLGFDGIVVQNVERVFPGMRLNPGTSHVHIFNETPAKIKATESEFTDDPRIKFSKKTVQVSPETDKFFGRQKTTIERITESLAQEPVKRFKKWATTYGIDRLNPIKVLGNETYMLHRMQGNLASQMASFLQYGKFEWMGNALSVNKDKNGGFLKWYERLEDDGPKFLQWVAAKRAAELAKPTEAFPNGRETFLTEDKRNLIFEKTWAPDDKRALALNKEFQSYNNNILDMAEQAGIINKDSRKEWEQEFYIPFYRLIGEEEGITDDLILTSPSKIRRHVKSGIKQLKGADAQLGNPMENILQNWTHLINESMRNQSRAHAFEAGKRMGMMKRVPRSFLKMSDKTTLSFLREGETVFFQTKDAELFNALSEFNHEHLDGMLAQLFGKAKSALTWGVTIGPAFRVANSIRDTFSTGVVSPHFIPVIDSFRGAFKMITKHPDFISFAGSGGAFTQGYVRGHDPQAQAEHIMKVGKGKAKIYTLKGMYDAWQYLGDVSEMSARIQLYSNLKKKGASQLEAAYEAKDIMDFTLKGGGKTMTSLTNMIPFMNARIQGLYRLGRGAKDNPVSFLTKGSLLTIASMALWAMFKDDDRYKELPDEQKWLYHHVWIGDNHIQIPKAFEVGLMFSSVFEEAGNIINGTEDGKHIMDFMGHAFKETLAMNIFAPQLLKPIGEVYLNRNSFTGRAIEGMGMEKRSPGKRYDPWTPEAMKALGEKLNMSPKKATHLIRGYFGSFGAGLIMAADAVYTSVVELPDRPSMGIDKYPMVGRFAKGSRAKRTKYGQRIWDMYSELEEVNSDLNWYKKNQRIDDARKLYKNERTRLMAYERAKPYKKQLDTIRNQMFRVWIGKNLTTERKDSMLKRLEEKRNVIQKRMYDDLKKIMK